MDKFDRVVVEGKDLSFSKSESDPCETLINRDSSISFNGTDFLHARNRFPNDVKISPFNNSSLSFPLNDSLYSFSQGLPGSINKV
jgi:hypothetical protein